MKVPILQVSLCSTVEWFATFALLRFKEYLHQFCVAQFANEALSSTYFAILALLELCKIICFPSLCSGTKYISTARSARCANKVHFWFNFYEHGELCLHSAFTARWIKKYILSKRSPWKKVQKLKHVGLRLFRTIVHIVFLFSDKGWTLLLRQSGLVQFYQKILGVLSILQY